MDLLFEDLTYSLSFLVFSILIHNFYVVNDVFQGKFPFSNMKRLLDVQFHLWGMDTRRILENLVCVLGTLLPS
jgi:hypothetical protein